MEERNIAEQEVGTPELDTSEPPKKENVILKMCMRTNPYDITEILKPIFDSLLVRNAGGGIDKTQSKRRTIDITILVEKAV